MSLYKVPVPVLRKCCFCLPLRRGLIAWGYLKLILAFMLLLLSAFIQVTPGPNPEDYAIYVDWIIFSLTLPVIATVDFFLHVLFVYGAHKKDVKFLRIYYFYSIFMLLLTTVLELALVFFIIDFYYYYTYVGQMLVKAISVIFLNSLIHAYVILLLRSEIFKHNSAVHRFVNNAAEDKRTLQSLPAGDQDTLDTIAKDTTQL